MYGEAFAHGTEGHGKTAEAQMQKLHAIMPMFSVASAGLETALGKGDAAAVELESGRMLAAVPDLKKSKPHRNVSQRNNFLAFATNLEVALTSTVNLAKKGDFAGAKTSFTKVEKVCAACHAKFR